MTESPPPAGDRRLDNPSIINQYDRPKVTVRRAAGQPAETNALPIVFDVVFDEPVIDFPVGLDVGGIVFTGSAAGLHYDSSGQRAEYRVTIRSVEEDGLIALAVPAQLTADLFGNVNTASADEDAWVHYDATRPQCIIRSDQEGVVNNQHMNFALVFSEPVFGLRDEALTLKNASLERISGQNGDTHYQFVVTPRADGTAALTVPEDAVTDAVGNGNLASPVFSLIVDSTGPEVHLSSFETAQASNSWVIRVHAVFNEPVVDFGPEDVSIHGASIMNFSAREDGQRYLFDVRPTAEQVHLSIPGGVVHDVIGNPNAPSNLFQREVDRHRPTVSIEVPTNHVSQGGLIAVDVLFSEPVYGFGVGGLKVSGGTAYWGSGQDGDAAYQVMVEPSAMRRVTFEIKAGAVHDLAGNTSKGASVRFTPQASVSRIDGTEAGIEAPPLQKR